MYNMWSEPSILNLSPITHQVDPSRTSEMLAVLPVYRGGRVQATFVRSKNPFFETPKVLFAMENILYL